MKRKVLFYGLPAAGKTTLASYFARRGKHAYDSDVFSRWVDRKGNPVRYTHSQEHDKKWLMEHEWRWDKKKLFRLLKGNREVYIFGFNDEQEELPKYLKYFDEVYYLRISRKQLSLRLASRKGKDKFGGKPAQRRLIYSWIGYVEEQAKKHRLKVIDASLGKEEIFGVVCTTKVTN